MVQTIWQHRPEQPDVAAVVARGQEGGGPVGDGGSGDDAGGGGPGGQGGEGRGAVAREPRLGGGEVVQHGGVRHLEVLRVSVVVLSLVNRLK